MFGTCAQLVRIAFSPLHKVCTWHPTFYMYHHIFKVSYIQAMMIKVNLWVLELILECLLDGSVGSTKENVIQTHLII